MFAFLHDTRMTTVVAQMATTQWARRCRMYCTRQPIDVLFHALWRWTCPCISSTAHRVIVLSELEASSHCYSIAFFVDPDATAVVVSVHDKFVTGKKPFCYEHVMLSILASAAEQNATRYNCKSVQLSMIQCHRRQFLHVPLGTEMS
jgi:hypothetical protein